MGMPALAMTDHGNVFGAYDFWKQGRAAGVKPIIGIEAYLTPGHPPQRQDPGPLGRRRRRRRLRRRRLHPHDDARPRPPRACTTCSGSPAWPASRATTTSRGWTASCSRPTAKGIIATTGCASGEVQTLLRLGRYDDAKRSAAEFQDIFGKDNFFCELMDHGLDIEQRVQADLLRLAKELDLPLVATNDLHYTCAKDAEAHEVLLCVQSGATLADPNRFKFDADDFYLKTPAEMRDAVARLPRGLRQHAGDRRALRRVVRRGRQPDAALPGAAGGERESPGWSRRSSAGCSSASQRRRPRASTAPRPTTRSASWCRWASRATSWSSPTWCRYAKDNGIRVGPGRGSAAGSIVAYALGITELDPIKHGLLFERFLNPERISMPDIDLDFDERRRGDMIRYATEKYGEERVAQIITYGTIKAKQAVKDSARVLGFPFAMGDRITKAMPPPVMGKDVPLAGIFDTNHPRYNEAGEFRTLYETDPDVKRVVDTARGLEGLKRQWGVHAAGVIMSSEPLLDVIPIMRREQDGAIITQFDMGACETLGLLKMDFLGLRNLTVLDDCLDATSRPTAARPSCSRRSASTTSKAYELLARGDTLGVFQLDGGPMRSLLRSMKPDNFEDISAVLALYRPGPMGANAHNDYADRKNGRKPIVADPSRARGAARRDPRRHLRPDRLPGAGHGDRPAARRLHPRPGRPAAPGDGQEEEGDPRQGVRPVLRRACGPRGYSEAAIKKLWDVLVPFSDYAFNKAHTAGYGLVSYWTAYLKANYPAEYMAALLTSVRDDKDKSALYLNECRRMGIKVLPPDVNESDADYTPRGTDIRFGLSAIRNVGENVVASIAATRSAKGRFADFSDFLRKVDPVACNKKTVESLIKAGAFDSLGHTRRGLLAVHAEAIDSFMATKRNEAHGQFDLFGGGDDGGSGGDEPDASP